MARRKKDAVVDSEVDTDTDAPEVEASEEATEAAPVEEKFAKRDARAQIGALLAGDVLTGALKVYGKKSLIEGSEIQARKVKRIPTGVFPLDYALAGGWAVGGVHTLIGHKSSGKTTVLYRTIGEVLKLCGNCWDPHEVCACKKNREPVVAYLDVEGALDVQWASRFFDISKILVSTPEYAEQAIAIGEALLRSKKCDIIIFDSIAFMTPAKEVEEAVEKDMVGVQARTLGKGMRKFTAALNESMAADGKRPTIFMTNQIRMKVGVMFGCFHADTPVMFADGSQHRIADVVKHQMEGPVLSWDGEKVVERKVINWFQNGDLGPDEQWLRIDTDSPANAIDGQSFTCTPNHVLVNGDGKEVRACDIHAGDTLLSRRGFETTPVGVRSVLPLLDRDMPAKYDLQIEGDSFYLVGGDSAGVVVHNSPETAPGGLSAGFFAWTEVKTKTAKYKMDDSNEFAHWGDFGFTIEKSKTSVPRASYDYRQMMVQTEDKGLGDIYDEDFILAQAEKHGLVTGGGAKWQCMGETFTGKKNLVENRILKDKEFRKKLTTALIAATQPT